MSTSWPADALVPLTPESDGRYKRNYLRQAVCELRFPTLLGLAGSSPPASFVSALRKRYPNLERGNEVTIGIGEEASSKVSHLLRSAKLNWAVALKQSAVVIETSRYTGYAEFRERIEEVIEAALPVIDSDFFTRVGLRYINVIKTDKAPLSDWVNPALVGMLDNHGFKGIREFAGKLVLTSEEGDGGCLLQHGLQHKPDSQQSGTVPDYVIDVDAFRNEVPAKDVLAVLDSVHRQAFSLFDWTLGPKAKTFLLTDKN